MNEEMQQVLTVGRTRLAVRYLGYEIKPPRTKLRKSFNMFDKEESKIAEALEALVDSGQLRPFVPE